MLTVVFPFLGNGHAWHNLMFFWIFLVFRVQLDGFGSHLIGGLLLSLLGESG